MNVVNRLMPLAQRVFRSLADGAVHSGEQLARRHKVSRSAVWKAVGTLQELGVSIEAAPRRGYQLLRPVVPLEAARIGAYLAPALRSRLRDADAAWSLASTNDALMARLPLPAGQFDVLVSEYQTAGRGRRSRPWFAPPGGALCLSLNWSFATLPRQAPALSLAIGVCARRALARLTPTPVQLKWPNDLIANGRKLGGILIELQAETGGPALVVVGIGINCTLGPGTMRRVQKSGTEPIDLAALGLGRVDRNVLAAELLTQCVHGLLEFEHHGLAGFAAEWRASDMLLGQVVEVSAPGGPVVGHARGIDAHGALCVQGTSGLQRFNSGEVSVRPRS